MRVASFVATARGRYLCMLASNTLNVFALITIPVLHEGVMGRPVPFIPLGLHVPSPFKACARVGASGIQWSVPCPLDEGVWRGLSPLSKKQRHVGGAKPSNINLGKYLSVWEGFK